MVNSARFLATVLGIAGGVIELYIGWLAANEPGAFHFKIGLVLLLPFAMMVGAAMITVVGQTLMGAGVMIMAASVQHVVIEIKSIAYVPLALVAAAAALAFFVEAQRQAIEGVHDRSVSSLGVTHGPEQ